MFHLFWAVSSIFLFTSVLCAGEPGPLQEVDRLYLDRDQRAKAEEELALLRREIGANPKNDEILWRLARALKWEGDQTHEHSEKIALYKQAMDVAKEAVALNAKSVGGHFWLGVAMGKIGETQGMFRSVFLVDPIKKEMETVLSLEPNHGGAHLVLGVMYRELPVFLGGSNKRSLEELKKAISVEPRRTLPYLELARTYLEEDRDGEAAEILRSLLSVSDPIDPVESRTDKREAMEILFNIDKR